MEQTAWPNEGTRLVSQVQPPGFVPVTEEALDEIIRRIVRALRPHRIILFGSYARLTPSDDSDVDLLIVMDTEERPAERFLAVSRLLRPRPFPLDILVKTPQEVAQDLEQQDPFIAEIVAHGQVLYERDR